MDLIQRRLKSLDQQSLSLAKRVQNFITRAPLFFPASSLIIGIILSGFFANFFLPWLITLPLVTACYVFWYIKFVDRAQNLFVPVFCTCLCFLALGAIRLSSFNYCSSNDIRNFLPSQSQSLPVTVKGYILTEPRIHQHENWKFARFKPGDPSSSFYLKVTEIKTTKGWTKIQGKIWALVNEPVVNLDLGDQILAYCTLRKIKPPTNPGQFNMAAHLSRKGVYTGAFIELRDSIEILAPQTGFTLAKLKVKLNNILEKSLFTGNTELTDSKSLLKALLLGNRSQIPSKLYNSFRRTGLLHFISLSGLHVGILIAGLWFLLRRLSFSKRLCALLCMFGTVGFLLVVPARSATIRAAIMTLIFCLAIIFRRTPNPLNTLSLAAIILLLIRPTQLFEPGWQLSFTAVLGIIFFNEPIRSKFGYYHIKSLLHKRTNKQTLYFRFLLYPLLSALTILSIGISAWLGGNGILLYHFQSITPLSSLWTVVVFPMVMLTLWLGYLQSILGILLPTISIPLRQLVQLTGQSLTWLVKSIDQIGNWEIIIGSVPIFLIFIYYTIITMFLLPVNRYIKFRKACLTATIPVILIFGIWKYHQSHNYRILIHCLDVGHGQALIIQTPDNKTYLFDAGSLFKSDIGRKIIYPFTRK